MTLFGTTTRVSRPGGDDALALMARDRAWAAYPLSYLDPATALEVQTFIGARPGHSEGLVALTQLPRLVSLFAMGDPDSVAAIVGELRPQPVSGVFSVREETLGAIDRHLRVTTSYRMIRMRVTAARLRPRRAAAAVRLGMDDLEDARRLYGMWTDLNQLPAQLGGGVYFGVRSGPDLVAIAGTHCLTSRHRVGVVGNVLTHAAHRNRGLAATTTTAVAEELFRMGCEEVVLNVRIGNDAAWRCYQHLGFDAHCAFVEGVFHTRR
jgi:RimJ/RimL family protein N-acetyltransferase